MAQAVDQGEKQLYVAGSLGRTACCPALGCVADAGLKGNPQGRGPHCLSRGFSGRGGGSGGQRVLKAAGQGPTELWSWGVGDGGDHFFPLEGGMLQEERV